MRLELAQAVGLVAFLHLAGPLLAPAQLDPGELDRHLGQRVAIEARVADVDVGETVHEVVLRSSEGEARVLSRAPPPPLGAKVRVAGDAAAGRGGPVLWTDGPWTMIQLPDRSPQTLGTLLAQAPERAGTTVAVRGRFDANESVLVDDDRRLPVRVLGPVPPPTPILAWGSLRYVPEEAGYRLDATGWRPWAAQSP